MRVSTKVTYHKYYKLAINTKINLVFLLFWGNPDWVVLKIPATFLKYPNFEAVFKYKIRVTVYTENE